MKQTVNEYDFRRAFESLRPDNFSHEGLGLLFEHFEEYEDSTGEAVELDVIAICCDYSEDTWEAIADNYSIDTSDCEDEEDAIQEVENYLSENTYLVGKTSDNHLIYQNF